MSSAIITGTWEGHYTYGLEYSVAYQTTKEHYTMELTVTDGIISGTCIDRFTKDYFGEFATVEGSLIDDVISLIKKYPYFLGVDEQDQIYTDRSLPAHEIHYLGKMRRKLFSREYFMEGTWDISGSYLDEEGNPCYYTEDGEWEMHRLK